MKYGCCLGIDHYDLIRQCQADTICLPAKDIAAAEPARFKAIADIIQQGTLEANALNSFCPPEIRLNGPDFDLARLQDFMALLLERSAQLGIKYIGIGAPQSRSIPAGFAEDRAGAQFDQAIDQIARQAKAYDIDILLEAVCSIECNFITTTDEALAVVRRLGLPNVSLVYDMYHAYMMNETAESILKARDSIKLVHIAKNVSGHRDYPDAQMFTDMRALFQGLQDIAYSGEIDVEAFYGDPASELGPGLDLLKKEFSRKG